MNVVFFDVITTGFEKNPRSYLPALFSGVNGFTFDVAYLNNSQTSQLSRSVPIIPDQNILNISDDLFQSGIGFKDDLALANIYKAEKSSSLSGATLSCANNISKANSKPWRPQIKSGYAFFEKEKQFIYPNDTINQLIIPYQDSDGFYKIDLHSLPKSNTQIGYFDINPYYMSFVDEWDFVDKFTGILNSDNTRKDTTRNPEYIDTSKKEYLIQNTTNSQREYLEPYDSEVFGEGKIYRFLLTESPSKIGRIKFTNQEIFLNEVSYNDFIEKFDNNELKHGTYTVQREGLLGELKNIIVYSDTDCEDFGYIFYSTGKISIVFNQNPSQEVRYYSLGKSDGTTDQKFYLEKFPVLDLTYSGIDSIDSESIKVYVDEVEWDRVLDIYETDENGDYIHSASDNIWSLDYGTGSIQFGGGGVKDVNGRILPGRIPLYNSEITISCQEINMIFYVPENSNYLFEDETADLSPFNNSIEQGFVFLSRRNQQAKHLLIYPSIDFINGSTNRYGPKVAGQEQIYLSSIVIDEQGDPMPGVIVNWQTDKPDLIFLESSYTITDQNGRTNNIAGISSSLSAFGTTVWEYEPLEEESFSLEDIDQISPNIPVSILEEKEESNVITTDIENDTLVLPRVVKDIEVNPEIIKQIFVYTIFNNSSFTPYNPYTQTSGRRILLNQIGYSEFEKATPIGAKIVGNKTHIQFNTSLPVKDKNPLFEDVSLQVLNPGFKTLISLSEEADIGDIITTESPDLIGEWSIVNKINQGGAFQYELDRPFIKDEATVNIYNIFYNLLGYQALVLYDLVNISAYVNCSLKKIISNTLSYDISTADQFKGALTLYPPVKSTDAIFLSESTYLNINPCYLDFLLYEDEFYDSEDLLTLPEEGAEITLIGQNIPVDRPVYVILQRGRETETLTPTNVSSTSMKVIVPSSEGLGSGENLTCRIGIYSGISSRESIMFYQETE